MPDAVSSASVFLAYACDGVALEVPAGFAFGPNTPGGDPVEGEIAVEIGCVDTDCEWYLDVDMPNDPTAAHDLRTSASPAENSGSGNGMWMTSWSGRTWPEED